jgi:isoleucyl-tRNA synthetase
MQPSYSEAANGGGSSNPVKPGKSDSVHFLGLPSYDPSRLNQDAVEAMETLQTIVELGRNVREKRLINLKTPVKNVVVVLRNPSVNVIKAVTGPLKSYILSELNAWELTIIPKEEEHEWVTLSLTPDFKLLGKKFGKKMKAVAAAIKSMSHAEAVAALEKGSIEIEGGTVDALAEVVSKLSFSREGEQWESSSTHEGDFVVAVDCTQDEAILAAGRARELINAIQQLRKNAGLDLKDKVEAFFEENETDPLIEGAVSTNVDVFKNKFKGSVPLPKRFAPSWSVVIGTETVEISGSKVTVTICRPAIAVKDGLSEEAKTFLSTTFPSSVSEGQELSFVVDGKNMTVKEGSDFWLSTASKLGSTGAVSWLA